MLETLGDIPHEGAEKIALAGAHRIGHGDLDRKLAPVAVQATQLEAPVHDGRVAGLVKPAQPLDVRGPEPGRNNRLRQLPADHVVARPAECRRRLRVPPDDPSVGIHTDERVVRRIEDEPRPGLALGEVLHGLPAVGIRQRDDDQVGERQGKVLLVDLPRARPAHVLDAHHAERPIFLPERHVEHRADAVRRQVQLAELARPRIGVRVGRRDDPIVSHRAEICRHVALVEPLAGRVLAGRALEQVVAAKRRAVVLEAPGAHARDLERARARLEDHVQPIGHRHRDAGLPRGQLGQRLALCRQPALTVPHFLLRRVRRLEEPVDGSAELGQVAPGAPLLEPGRPAVGVKDGERPRADLVDAPDQPEAKNAGHEQRHAQHEPADEQDLFGKRCGPAAVPRTLDEVEGDEADNQRDDDGDAGLEHAGRSRILTLTDADPADDDTRHNGARPAYCDVVACDAGFITRFSMKNSIMRSALMPLWPRSGPTCTSKLFPACCSAAMSCIMFDGCTLLSAVP